MYKSDKAAVLFRIEGESTASSIACLGDASLSSSMNVDSRSCIGSKVPQKTAMDMDWNVSFSGIADLTEDGVQERLFSAYKSGKRISLEIIYNEDPLDGYEGTVVLSDWSVSLSAPGIAEVSFSGTGASELFLIHESSLGSSITIMNIKDELASGEEVLVKVFPSKVAVTFSVDGAATGISIGSSDGKVAYTAAVTNGTEFTVKATSTSGSVSVTATKTFKVVGQTA